MKVSLDEAARRSGLADAAAGMRLLAAARLLEVERGRLDLAVLTGKALAAAAIGVPLVLESGRL